MGEGSGCAGACAFGEVRSLSVDAVDVCHVPASFRALTVHGCHVPATLRVPPPLSAPARRQRAPSFTCVLRAHGIRGLDTLVVHRWIAGQAPIITMLSCRT